MMGVANSVVELGRLVAVLRREGLRVDSRHWAEPALLVGDPEDEADPVDLVLLHRL